MKIAVDFDGTIVEHRYPEIGKEVPLQPSLCANSLMKDTSSFSGACVKENCWMRPWRGVKSAAYIFTLSTRILMKTHQKKAVISAVKSKPIFLLTTAMSAACQTGALSIHSYIAA